MNRILSGLMMGILFLGLAFNFIINESKAKEAKVKSLTSSIEMVVNDIWDTAEKSVDMAKEGFSWLIQNPEKGKFFVKCDSGSESVSGTKLGMIRDTENNRDYYLDTEECELFTGFLNGMKSNGFKDVKVKLELSVSANEEISLNNKVQNHYSANVREIDIFQPKQARIISGKKHSN